MGSRCKSIIGIFSGQSSPVFPRFPLLRLFFSFILISYSLIFSSFLASLFCTFFTYIHIFTYNTYIYTFITASIEVHQLQLSSARNVQLSSPRLYSLFYSLL